MGITIIPTTIHSTHVALAHALSVSRTDQAVNDSSSEKLLECEELLSSISHQMEDTVVQYNNFLNELASTFEAKDAEMAGQMGLGLSLASHPGNQRSNSSTSSANVRNSDAYKMLG